MKQVTIDEVPKQISDAAEQLAAYFNARGVLAAAVKDAEAKGKKKATAKTLPKTKKVAAQVLPAGPAPAERGQTLPPVQPDNYAALFELVNRVAAVNIVVSNLDRATIAQIVQDARNLLGVK